MYADADAGARPRIIKKWCVRRRGAATATKHETLYEMARWRRWALSGVWAHIIYF